MIDWVAFWDSNHCIYVNASHRDVHYRTIADEIVAYIPSASATVLDYGCGEALHARRIAAHARRVILVDAAPGVRAKLAEHFSGDARIEVRSPDALASLSEGSLDIAVMNSVIQYLTADQLDVLLATFRRLLRPGGALLIGDVIPPDVSAATDTIALLHFGARHGFLLAAIGGVLRTIGSDYRRLRSQLGLSRYTETAMRSRLAAAGFSSERARKNIGHNQARMTFVARPS